MPGNLSGPTLLVILFIVLLLFGAPKLPALARSLGQSMKILKKEVSPEDKAAAEAKEASEQLDPVAQAQAEAAAAKAEAEAAKAEAAALKQQAAAEAAPVVETSPAGETPAATPAAPKTVDTP